MKHLIQLSFLFLTSQLWANNIKVENLEIVEQNTVANTVKIRFDLSWENSWRLNSGPANYDAAWVFVKYRENSGNWNHVLLNYVNGTSDGHSVPSGVSINTTSDQVGCFIFRSSTGSGSNDWNGIELLWEYSDNFLGDNAQVDIQVHALEMVYVPEGAFNLGGGSGNEVNKFYAGGFSTSTSYTVSSEAPITIANSAGNLYYTADNSSGGDQSGTLNASYPKGFGAFYCMKYETTEGQWLAFFNSLNPSQKLNRDVTDATHKNSDAIVSRNTVSWAGGSDAATSLAPDRAMSYLSPADKLAYMDWSGLRPMTELEYEKACRGTAPKIANDFAWGNANITAIDYLIQNDGTSSENISNSAVSTGNAIYSESNGLFNGPLRVGIFASSAINKNREETGATFYGIMEMSGNLYERVVTVGTVRGRQFSGLHGNGIINSTSGSSTVGNWPTTTTGDGFSYRGGSWTNGSNFIRVSDRFDGATLISVGNNRLGFRAARTAE